MSPLPLASNLKPAPFVGDIPRIQPASPPLNPVNNIAPFRPIPYSAPPPPPPIIPAAAAVPAAAGAASAPAALLLIPPIVIGGLIGGTAQGLSPGTLPTDRPLTPFMPPPSPVPAPAAPKNPNDPSRPPRPVPPGVSFGTWRLNVIESNGEVFAYPDRQGLSTDVYAKQDYGLANIYGVRPCIGISLNGAVFAGCFSSFPFTLNPVFSQPPAPAAPPAPAPPSPRPDGPRPDRPQIAPGVKPGNVPKPFTRPLPKTTPPAPSPGTPNPGPKPFNVPRPFTRPPRPGQPSPDRRLPPPNDPGPGPKPKPDPSTPGQPLPDRPSTEPAPKTPQTPAPDRPRIPGPVPVPTPQTLPPFSPQFDPPTVPFSPFNPVPVPDSLPAPRPRIDPNPSPTPNPNPVPVPVPFPLPVPNLPPQTDTAPKIDPSPTPNPNPRRFPPPPLPPQTDTKPKLEPNRSPNPNPPYFPPPIIPPILPPGTPPPINPPNPNPPRPPSICPPCPDPCPDVPIVQITYREFVSCQKILGVKNYFRNKTISVPQPDSAALKIMLDNQADLLALQCEDCDCVAAVPDWWQVRLGADRPQLVVLYARKFNDLTWDKPKYAISIPWWSKSQADTVASDFPDYAKGQYQGTTIFSDNSKLIVNCIAAVESERVTNKLMQSILTSKKENSTYSTTFRRGRALAEITVYPRVAKYFATGQLDMQPTWTKKL